MQQQEINSKLAAFDQLYKQNEELQRQMSISQAAIDKMEKAFDQGLFKQDDNLNIIPVDDPAERAHLASTAKKLCQEADGPEMSDFLQLNP